MEAICNNCAYFRRKVLYENPLNDYGYCMLEVYFWAEGGTACRTDKFSPRDDILEYLNGRKENEND